MVVKSINKLIQSNRYGRRQLIWATVVILIIASLISFSFQAVSSWRVINRPLTEQPETYIFLAPGESLWHILDDLEKRGLFAKKWHWWLDVMTIFVTTDHKHHLQAGEYVVTGRSILELLTAMANGQVHRRFFTLIPGWSWLELQRALARSPGIDHTTAQMKPKDAAEHLGLSLPFVNGAFYPDTYSYRSITQDVVILQEAHRKMLATMEQLWPEREPDLPIANIGEALVLASLIEKETGLESDRAMVSSVIVNRLRVDMKLDIDSTVIFALGATFDGTLTRENLAMKNPFNTYIYKGLPLTPIALPSYNSIVAALHPATSDAYFFVSRGDGSSQFSKTLKLHKAAVDKYILNKKSDG